MAQQTVSLMNNQTLTSSDGNGTHTLFTSPIINNNNNLPCVRIVVEYSAVNPNDDVNVEKTFGISAILEAKIENNWFPVAYQFEPYRSPSNGNKRIIVLQPDISDFNAGIDDIIYLSGATEARISRQQGKASAQMRFRVILHENGGWVNGVRGDGAFQSVTVTAYGELYDGI